ncbi:MAG TPA: carboxypeptidase regulatory-like domain-containing protein [Bryobacteraceae bacterium]|jgi:plastocyanin|nr:carboxypeptidase regulatory-like domain-containing protein [Bryobacteraceae bacterium]
MKNYWIAAGLASVLALAGCGGSSSSEAPKTAESAAPAAGAGTAGATPDEANGGTITGKVAFDGTPPVMKTLDMSATAYCEHAHQGKPVKSEEVVVNPNGTLKNAFVWVKSGLPADKQWAVPTNSVLLDQTGCMYSPHVVGVMAGQSLDIKTSDQTNHNIHPMPKDNPEWNETQAPGTPDKQKTFARQEVMIPVKCNIHPWMRAYIGVVPHPFFAVTGDDGTYTIKGLPPGTYTVEVWHEKYGTQDQQVTVGAKETKTQDFTIKG